MAPTISKPPPRSILIINPNSTESMTKALEPVVKAMEYPDTLHAFFTGPPSSPPSINDLPTIAASASACLPHLRPLLSTHSAFLVACYSPHPLVPQIKSDPLLLSSSSSAPKPVVGIMEASVTAALLTLAPGERFGVVSTGKAWETILGRGVREFLGTCPTAEGEGEGEGQQKGEGGNATIGGETEDDRFAGVTTTGLHATELHTTPRDVVERRVNEAVKKLLARGRVAAICLGCAGMAGMDAWVREACVEALGEEQGGRVRIVDGVKAAVASIEGALRMGV
ncbi:Asp/Glu/hydantoin racemase [Phyllosticta citribraziliensis]|uniref:Asp/Glu/hydantoin racemase n=1 Tax=Phyllosticta citribraziliensis TaxID=989973 RepID=A0ABR1M1G3_9PEZI